MLRNEKDMEMRHINFWLRSGLKRTMEWHLYKEEDTHKSLHLFTSKVCWMLFISKIILRSL